MEFTRDTANTDLIYEVESSSDLHQWTTIARSSGGKTFEQVGIVPDYVAEQPLGGTKVLVTVGLYKVPRMYLRVRVRRE